MGRGHPISNIAGHLGKALKRIQYRLAAVFSKVDAGFGTRMAEALAIDTKKAASLAAMTDEGMAAAPGPTERTAAPEASHIYVGRPHFLTGRAQNLFGLNDSLPRTQ